MALRIKAEPLGRAWGVVGRGRSSGSTAAPLQLYLEPPPLLMRSSSLRPWQLSDARALSHLWGFVRAVFSARNTSLPVAPPPTPLLRHLSHPPDSQCRNSFLQQILPPPGPSAQGLSSCVHLRALNLPTIAPDTRDQAVCIPTGL